MLLTLFAPVSMFAQIGYQVALMDQSTGKPRANETVNVTVTISDNAGKTICSETSTQTTNSFGMLALQVGNAKSFDNVDWDKLPLWVSATVGGVTIGKSQILNVPVAEHAKHWGTLTKDILTSKTWRSGANNYDDRFWYTLNFASNGTCTLTSNYRDEKAINTTTNTGHYYMTNDIVCIDIDNTGGGGLSLIYIKERNILSGDNRIFR